MPLRNCHFQALRQSLAQDPDLVTSCLRMLHYEVNIMMRTSVFKRT